MSLLNVGKSSGRLEDGASTSVHLGGRCEEEVGELEIGYEGRAGG